MKKIVTFILLIIIAMGGVVFAIEWQRDALLSITEPLFFVVDKGDTLTSVAYDLEDKNIIKSAKILLLSGKMSGNKPVIAGSYEFPVGYRLKDLHNAITTGDAVSDEVQVTLVEGLTIEQIAEELVEVGLLESSQEFIVATSTGLDRFKSQFDFLSSIPEGQSLEGYLFPDTYRYFQDASVDEIILSMLRNFDNKLDNNLRQEIERSGKSIHEVITLASIVQREVRGTDEMAIVAGLFQNRLDIGMLLQADSTIGYVTKSGRDRSTFADLEIDSPYNTYKHAGLTPGPISNPGINAIIATIKPEGTDYLFFLTNRTTGIVYYGKNLAEHNQNRNLYLE